MRWNVVNYFFFTTFTAFTAFLTLFCNKSRCGEYMWEMRWIFVRNAVKCCEISICTAFTAITAFLTKIHRFHRISYKNLLKNLDPGWSRNWIYLITCSLLISHSFKTAFLQTFTFYRYKFSTQYFSFPEQNLHLAVFFKLFSISFGKNSGYSTSIRSLVVIPYWHILIILSSNAKTTQMFSRIL